MELTGSLSEIERAAATIEGRNDSQAIEKANLVKTRDAKLWVYSCDAQQPGPPSYRTGKRSSQAGWLGPFVPNRKEAARRQDSPVPLAVFARRQ
jgi:hypothetical protein